MNAKSLCFAFILMLATATNTIASNSTPTEPPTEQTISIGNTKKNVKVLALENSDIFKNSDDDSVIVVLSKKASITLNTTANVEINLPMICNIEKINLVIRNANHLKITGNKFTAITFKINNKSRSLFLNSLEVIRSYIQLADLENLTCNSIHFIRTAIKNLSLKNATINTRFYLSQVRMDSANFNHTLLPDTIQLDSLDLSNISGKIDFTKLRDVRENKSGQSTFKLHRTLKISNTDFDKLNLNYDRYGYHIDPNQDVTKSIWMFEKLLQKLQSNGLQKSFEHYNREYRVIVDEYNHTGLTNFINRHFWNRGLSRSRACTIVLVFFTTFFFTNLFWFNSWRKVYYPNSFNVFFQRVLGADSALDDYKSKRIKKPHIWKVFAGMFFYTTFIFWGLRLEISELKLHGFWSVTYILFQYLIGLLFVAYIISFIIVR